MSDSFPKHQLDSQKLRASDNTDMIGKSYMHSRNHRVYHVTGLVWNGDNDCWMVEHGRMGTETRMVRSLANFNGKFDDGSRRFIEIVKD